MKPGSCRNRFESGDGTIWRVFLALAILVAVAPLGQADDLLSELSASQVKSLNAGKDVVVTVPVADSSLPLLKVYRKVDASPGVVASLFTDYDQAPSYQPNMISAKVVSEPNPKTKDVEYTIKMPVLNQITYTVRNTYEQDGDDYTVRWTLLKSPLAKKSEGSLRVQPYEGGSVLCYTNLLEPIIPVGGLLKSSAVEETKTTVNSLATEAEKRAKG